MKKIALAFAATMVVLSIITLPSCDQPAVVPKHYIFDTTGSVAPPTPTGKLNVTCYKGTSVDVGATVRVYLSQSDLNVDQNRLFPDQSVDQGGTATFILPSPANESLPTCSSGQPSRTYYVYAFDNDPTTGHISAMGTKDVCATQAHPFSLSLFLK